MAADLTTKMDALVACVSEALAGIDRAACSTGLTVGPPEPGPAGCCSKCGGTTVGGQVTGFLERVFPAEKTREGIQEVQAQTCRNGSTAADVTLVVLRCYPSMDTQGNMPSLDKITPYAHSLNDDMTTVWAALKCCDQAVEIRDSGVDASPEAGCSAFAIRVTLMVSMVPPVEEVP
jgi:hypothetical protein